LLTDGEHFFLLIIETHVRHVSPDKIMIDTYDSTRAIYSYSNPRCCAIRLEEFIVPKGVSSFALVDFKPVFSGVCVEIPLPPCLYFIFFTSVL
jgi:hypothetical protein